jgi:hypothetical protein
MVLNFSSASIALRRWLGIERQTEMEYWQERAARYGRPAVLNIAHPEEEFDLVTENQKREIIRTCRAF